MKISDNGLAFIARSEGFRDKVYDDEGHPAIGYGHDILPGESFPDGINEARAREMLAADADKAAHAVERLVKVPLTQGQFDACADFCFNVGADRLKNSTFLKYLNKGKLDLACQQLYWEDSEGSPHGWIYSGNKINKGLIGRRKGEQELFRS